jgi:alginate O-acetyltransferase complex protein AlgI
MSPVSIEFFAFAALALLATRAASRFGGNSMAWTLIVFNFLFLGFAGPSAFLAFTVSCLGNFLLTRAMRKEADPARLRFLLRLGLCWNIVIIFMPKWAKMSGWPLLLLGVSYYSIQQIMTLYDLYEQRLDGPKVTVGGDGSLRSYLSFVSFFPQLTSGPICSWRETGRQLTAPEAPDHASAFPGILILAHGLFHKVVLSSVFSLFADVLSGGAPGNGYHTLFGLTCSYLSLYFDFSGYTDIAIGLGWLFGVRLPLNFNQPLRAASVADFWARWHMSLSAFVKNYIYFPVFRRYPTSKVIPKLAMLASMMVVGIWHEPSWRFFIFGTLHGCALLYWPFPAKPKTWSQFWISWTATHLFVILTMAFFTARDVPGAVSILSGLGNWTPDFSWFTLGFDNYDKLQLALCLALGVKHVLRGKNTVQTFAKAQPSAALLGWLVFVVSLTILYSNSGLSRNFIYADF